jgi:hypothetical protein
MSEFIYILDNRSMQQAAKIVRTDKDTAELPKHILYYPGVRPPFTVFMKYVVSDGAEAERRIQERFVSYRDSSDATLFGIDAWQLAPMLDGLLRDLIEPTTPAIQDTQRQDELLSAATRIVISMGKIWPSALAGPLSISFDEAQQLIRRLQGRGVINADLDLCPDYLALHIRQEAEKRAELAAAKVQQEMIAQERRRREAEQSAAVVQAEAQPQRADQDRWTRETAQGDALAKLNPELVQAVNRLLDGLADPETGEPVEIRFVDDNGHLAVDIRGTDWVRLEAERRLSALYGGPSGN